MARALTGVAVATLLATAACGASRGSDAPASGDGGAVGDAFHGDDAAGVIDPESGTGTEGGTDAAQVPGRFVTAVVAGSFHPTDCTGFGAARLPGVVQGPPIGGGADQGSTDVVSLGSGGSITLSFEPNAIVDGPGPDFVVFENPFWIGGQSSDVYAEPGEVSVSDDGTTWHTFTCNPTYDPGATDGTGTAPPYGQCAGWRVVYSSPQNGISPFDPAVSGGDLFDLAQVGLTHARYVRIVDRTDEACPEAGPGKPDDDGFDLDAVAIIHAELP